MSKSFRINIPEDVQAGAVVAGTKYRGLTIRVKVGNDIEGSDWLGRDRVYKTLITESEIDGEWKHGCHVIVPLFFKSRITKRRIREAVETWKGAIDVLLDDSDTENE